ncbi:hypothetical protein EVAR_83249_1 [Eumeta japonica]|uniref:Uncharacterized protein n=1 Tax=Eumeta variegata TaxID=151549 RepID=A0A4C1Y0Z5_EUMVA|nr:hypothetical protein EVAR_83249_1 [Eumeta japonica]
MASLAGGLGRDRALDIAPGRPGPAPPAHFQHYTPLLPSAYSRIGCPMEGNCGDEGGNEPPEFSPTGGNGTEEAVTSHLYSQRVISHRLTCPFRPASKLTTTWLHHM